MDAMRFEAAAKESCNRNTSCYLLPSYMPPIMSVCHTCLNVAVPEEPLVSGWQAG